jgi:predicted murein hydrolase (TIGR00659 family)
MTTAEFYAHPLFGSSVTVGIYALATLVHRRVRWAHGLLTTCIALIALLVIARIPFASYNVGGQVVSFFLGPATVALGVPFYKHARAIRDRLPQVIGAISAGTVASILAGVGAVAITAGTHPVLLSMIPRGVTTPIAIEVCTQLGGIPALTAVLNGVSGLIGAVLGPPLLDWLEISDDRARGAAMGTAAHGIGTARILLESETAGGVSALAMALAGILTAILAVPIHWLLR